MRESLNPAPTIMIYTAVAEKIAVLTTKTYLKDRAAKGSSKDGMLSATVLITLPHDVPVFFGRMMRVNTGLRLHHEHGRPIVALEGVSIMRVSLPSAWLGGVKGKDLIALYGD